MKELTKAVIRADAHYFASNGFITGEQYIRVKDWLNGSSDTEIQLMVANWLKRDAEYYDNLVRIIIRRHWYLTPILAFTAWFVRKELGLCLVHMIP